MAAFLLWYIKMLKTNYVSFVEGIRSIPPLLTEEISYFIKETQNILSLRSLALYSMVIQRSSYDVLIPICYLIKLHFQGEMTKTDHIVLFSFKYLTEITLRYTTLLYRYSLYASMIEKSG